MASSPKNLLRKLVSLSLPAAVLALSGCGVQRPVTAATPLTTEGITGRVHGGQQPVGNSTIQLYTVGTTGDGSAATLLVTVQSDQNGNFSLSPSGTQLYSCTSATQVYITATGGDPIGTTPNPNLAMMTALGPCTSLTSGTFIMINELTTVAAIEALAPYMASATAIGSGTLDAAELDEAFQLASEFVNPSTGMTPGVNVPGGATVPAAEIATLANILSACVNSAGGIAEQSNSCGSLFSLTTVGSVVPVDTVAAMLAIAQNPTMNTTSLFDLAPPNSPFQPAMSAPPTTFAVGLTPEVGGQALTISAPSLTFGAETLGYTTPNQTVTITNSGTGTVTLGSISVGGSNAGDFYDDEAYSTCGTSLTQGSTCTFNVVFTPAAAGARSGWLAVNSSAPASPQNVYLGGTGITGTVAASVSPASLVWSATIPMQATLTNGGTTPLWIQSILGVGAGVGATSNCSTTLAANASCVITVTGTNAGMLVVQDNTATSPHIVTVNGGWSAAESCGPTMVGATSSTIYAVPSFEFQTQQPNNVVDFSTSGTNVGDFLTPQGTYCEVPVPEACNVTILFSPRGLGPRLAYYNSAYTTPAQVALLGSGVPPGPRVTMSLGQNGGTDQQYLTTPYSGTIYNVGTTNLNLSGTSALSAAGVAASQISFVSGMCPSSLAPGAHCGFAFNITPTSAGVPGVTVTATDATSGVNFSAPFTDTITAGTPPPPYVSISSIIFPTTPVGQNSSEAEMVHTVGAEVGTALTLTISGSSTFSFSPSSFVTTTTCPASSSSCTINLYYTPTQSTTTDTGSLVVADTTWGTSVTVPLSGMGSGGVAGQPPSLTITPGSLTFSGTPVGYTSATQPSTISNTGTTAATLSLSSTGTNATDFSASNAATTCGSSLLGGASCTVAVSFTPGGMGSRTGAMQITSNAANSPQSVSLSGTGTGLSSNLTLSASTLSYTIAGALQDVTLTNSGSNPIAISSITYADTSAEVASLPNFGLEQSTCGASIPALGSCTLSIISNDAGYTSPTAVVTSTGTLTIADSAPNSPQVVSLTSSNIDYFSATGSYPFPGIITFPNDAVGVTETASAVDESAVISVSGYAPGPTLGSFGDFSVTASLSPVDQACPGNLGSVFYGAPACVYTFSFKPTATGLRSAQYFLAGTNQYLLLEGTAH